MTSKRNDIYKFGEEQLKYHWQCFVEYAEAEGISLENKDDWESWWECYLFGAYCESLRG